jgi:hypothetical protein
MSVPGVGADENGEPCKVELRTERRVKCAVDFHLPRPVRSYQVALELVLLVAMNRESERVPLRDGSRN